MMDELISKFTGHLREALEIGRKADVSNSDREIRNILVTGLGGSGIGGNLVAELAENDLRVPMIVNKDYFIPNWVKEHTLVIVSSYSGNTEETLNAMQMALNRNCKIVCITSNGKVKQIAQKEGLDLIEIPGGMPPRACLGYSFVQQLFVLKKLGLTGDKVLREIEQAITQLDDAEKDIKTEAKSIAEQLHHKLPVIYITAGMESVAVRFRQQLNENSKILCWHHVIPEMNHNELVGWRNENQDLAVIFLRNDNDFERNQQRIDINKGVMQNYTDTILDIYSKGESKTSRALYLIHLTDWVTFFLAELRDMDAVEVNVIDHLKGELAKKEL